MQVDPESARTVAAVLDEGSFDAAARRLLLTPSAVSQRIKTLEQQLGRILLVRSKPVRATEAGEAVARFGRQIALLERDAIAGFGLAGEGGGGADPHPARGQRGFDGDLVPAAAGAARPSGTTSSSTCIATTRTSPRDCSSPGP